MRPILVILLLSCTSEDKTIIPQDSGLLDVITDLDGDGFMSDEDCDDGNILINPNMEEICDGLDNDCDSSTDESLSAPTANLTNGVCSGQVKVCQGSSGWEEPNYNLISVIHQNLWIRLSLVS